jgi:hypothetical protein
VDGPEELAFRMEPDLATGIAPSAESEILGYMSASLLVDHSVEKRIIFTAFGKACALLSRVSG